MINNFSNGHHHFFRNLITETKVVIVKTINMHQDNITFGNFIWKC